MGKIDIFRNGFVTFCKEFCNAPVWFVMLHYAFYRLQLAHTAEECILQRGGSDMLFTNDFWEDLFNII